MLASGPPWFSPFIALGNPVDILANPQMAQYFTIAPAGIIKVDNSDDLILAVPPVAMAVASYCKQQKLPVLRGCITSGEEWEFFIYKCDDGHDGAPMIGGKISFACKIKLGSSLENLPLVLGLLRDMIENALDYNQKYFSYDALRLFSGANC